MNNTIVWLVKCLLLKIFLKFQMKILWKKRNVNFGLFLHWVPLISSLITASIQSQQVNFFLGKKKKKNASGFWITVMSKSYNQQIFLNWNTRCKRNPVYLLFWSLEEIACPYLPKLHFFSLLHFCCCWVYVYAVVILLHNNGAPDNTRWRHASETCATPFCPKSWKINVAQLKQKN